MARDSRATDAPDVEGATARRTRGAGLWRNRDFLLLWSGQLISLSGTGVSQLAFPILMLLVTGSPLQMGLMTALRGVPFVTLALPAGALVDRWNRTRLMIVCDTVRGLVFGGLALALMARRLTAPALYGAGLVEGVCFTFFTIAESSALPQVVSEEQLPAAAAQNEASATLTMLVSPALGGALLSLARGLPFIVDAASYAISVATLGAIRTPLQQAREAQGKASLLAQTREGLAWLWRAPLLRLLGPLTGCVNGAALSAEAIAYWFAYQRGFSPAVTGLVIAAGGVGAVVGAALSASARRRTPFGVIIIAALWALTALWLTLVLATTAPALAVILALISLVASLFNVAQYSYSLAQIPDALQGRVNSVYRIFVFGLQPLWVALTGFLLQRVGLRGTVMTLGAALALLAIASLSSPHLRHGAHA